MLASDNDRLLGQKPAQNKIRCTFASSHHSDSGFQEVIYRKNRKSTSDTSNSRNNPISPNLQHIIANYPILSTNNDIKFMYANAMITDEVPDVNSPIDNDAINISPIPAGDTTNTT